MSDPVTPATDPATTPEAPAADGDMFPRSHVEELRRENAGLRTGRNAAIEEAKNAINQEWATKTSVIEQRTTALEADLGDAWVYAAKIDAAVAAGVPTDKLLAFVQILKGSDDATIKQSVESAKALFGGFGTTVPATDPTQGSGNGIKPHGLNSDALLGAVKEKLGI